MPSIHHEVVDSLIDKLNTTSHPHNLLATGEQVVGEKVGIGTSFSIKLSTTSWCILKFDILDNQRAKKIGESIEKL